MAKLLVDIIKILIILSSIVLLCHCPAPDTPTSGEIRVRQDLDILPDGTGIYSFDSVLADGDEGVYATDEVTFTIENNGNADLSISGIKIESGDFTDFDLVSTPGEIISPLGTSTFKVRFDPLSTGDKTAVMRITNDDPDNNPYTFTITGIGLAPEPDISVRQNTTYLYNGTGSYSFGNVVAEGNNGIASSLIVFTINDFGVADLTVDVSIFSGDTADFDLVDLPAFPVYESTTFTIRFDPLNAGEKSAVVQILNNDQDENPYTFTVTGAGVEPEPEINIRQSTTELQDGTGSFSFGNIIAEGNGGVASSPVVFTIENSGTANLTVDVSIFSGDTADFDLIDPPASPVSTSTTFTIRFDPLSAGAKSAVLQISNNDLDENPYTFTITGTGLVPEPVINLRQGTTPIQRGTGVYSFANTLAEGEDGAASPQISFTIENSGYADLDVDVTLSSGDTNDFELSESSLTSPIAPAGSSSFAVRFDPLAAGNKSVIVQIVNNDADKNPYTFTLAGRGISAGSIKGIVVESVGGAPVENATATVYGTGLSSVSDSNGEFIIGNIFPGIYDIILEKSGTAGSKMQAVEVIEGGVANIEMVMTKANMDPLSITPPTINVTGIVKGGSYSGVVVISVNVSEGSNPVAATSDHDSIYLRVGYKNSWYTTASSDTSSLTHKMYTIDFHPGSVDVDIVAYDINNNRSELIIPIVIQAGSGSKPSSVPSGYSITARTFGKTFGVFRKEQQYLSAKGIAIPSSNQITGFSASEDSTIVVFIEVAYASSTDGINVYRSDSETGVYTLVGSTTSKSNYIYHFSDSSPALTPGQSYWYKISYFNEYGNGSEISPVPVNILPKYNLNLTGPSNNSVISSTSPVFQWTAGAIPGATRYDGILLKKVADSGFAWTSALLIDSTQTMIMELMLLT